MNGGRELGSGVGVEAGEVAGGGKPAASASALVLAQVNLRRRRRSTDCEERWL
jgi:hypothetical protein